MRVISVKYFPVIREGMNETKTTFSHGKAKDSRKKEEIRCYRTLKKFSIMKKRKESHRTVPRGKVDSNTYSAKIGDKPRFQRKGRRERGKSGRSQEKMKILTNPDQMTRVKK